MEDHDSYNNWNLPRFDIAGEKSVANYCLASLSYIIFPLKYGRTFDRLFNTQRVTKINSCQKYGLFKKLLLFSCSITITQTCQSCLKLDNICSTFLNKSCVIFPFKLNVLHVHEFDSVDNL